MGKYISCWMNWDVDVYVTGSNSRLLSSELSTYLAGRYVSFHIMPLSFNEYLLFHGINPDNKEALREEFQKYLRMGGFPAVHTGDYSFESIYKLVYDIYSSVILRDTVQRHGIRNVELLERVVRFVFDNIGNRLTACAPLRHQGERTVADQREVFCQRLVAGLRRDGL